MIGKFSGVWNELSDNEKLEVVFFIFLTFFAVISILLAMAWSRGREVEMLKERVNIMEDRFNVAEKSRFALMEKAGVVEQRQIEHANAINNLQIRSVEMERWMEEYNRLPVLPKQKPPQSTRLTPVPRQ